jgi:hypothetical protein
MGCLADDALVVRVGADGVCVTKVFMVYDDGDEGEIEGAFDADGNLLDTWCNNDAHWRDEYFDGFMKKLGIEVVRSDRRDLVKKLREAWKE